MFLNFFNNFSVVLNMSVLETFESTPFGVDIQQYYTAGNQLLMEKSSFVDLLLHPSNSLFHISLFVTLIVLFFYFKMIENNFNVLLAFLSAILTQIALYLWTVETFVQTNIVFDLAFEDSLQIIKVDSNFMMITIFFLKESMSFISFLIVWWMLSNNTYTDTLLIPRTIIEKFDEFFYRQSLTMFSDVLQLKENDDVKGYQELFIKIHGIFLFILIANVQGMVPYTATITSSLVNTFFMAAAVYWYAVITVVKEKGLHHLFDLFFPSGCPYILGLLLIPIEFISYVFRVVSLSVRLFANMMAGHTLMKVIAGFSWGLILAGDVYILVHYVPFFVLFILTFLEIAVGFIQTYIFIILVYIYLSDIFVAH